MLPCAHGPSRAASSMLPSMLCERSERADNKLDKSYATFKSSKFATLPQDFPSLQICLLLNSFSLVSVTKIENQNETWGTPPGLKHPELEQQIADAKSSGRNSI